MKDEIVKINPSEYGLTDETAKNIQSQFEPMLNKMVELEEEFNKVVSLPIEEAETARLARELRLKYVKVRTGTADIHKAQKAFFLNGGRFVDGWKNAQIFASQGKENRLSEIENHLENIEKKRISDLQTERSAMVCPFMDSVPENLGTMDEDVWQAYYSAKRQAYDDRVEAERRAKEEAEIAAEAERKRIAEQAAENERLKKEAQEREAQIKAEREQAEKQRQELEAQAAKERAESDKKIKEEQEKAEAIKAELRKKEEEEQARIAEQKRIEEEKELQRIREEQEEKKKLEKMAKAPIKKQLLNWVEGFTIENGPDNEVAQEITKRFESFKNWAKSEIEKI